MHFDKDDGFMPFLSLSIEFQVEADGLKRLMKEMANSFLLLDSFRLGLFLFINENEVDSSSPVFEKCRRFIFGVYLGLIIDDVGSGFELQLRDSVIEDIRIVIILWRGRGIHS